jgi:hypothetical protein
MGHQALGLGMGVRGRLDLVVQALDVGIQPAQELETLASPARRVGRQRERLELRDARASEERWSQGEAIVEGDGVHPILDHRPHAHKPHAMGDERALVAHCGIREPHGGESVVPEEVQKMSGVTPVGLRLADHHRPDLRGIADDDLMAQPVQQRMKPEGVSRALDADRDGSRERRVELLDAGAIVGQTLLLDLARSGVEDRHLLIPRVEIASDQDHEIGLHSCDVVVLGFAETTSVVRPFS